MIRMELKIYTCFIYDEMVQFINYSDNRNCE